MSRVKVALQTSGGIQNFEINPGASLEQQDGSGPETQYESNHRTPEPRSGPLTQAHIEFRIKELHNRRFLLLKMQRFREKIEENVVGSTEGMTCVDRDQLCELEAIQEELQELLRRKEEMERNRFKLRANKGPQGSHPTVYKTEAPRGGVYMLPPPQLEEEDFTLEPRGKRRPGAGTPMGLVIPVDFLGPTAAVTKCPFCEEVVVTETHSRVGVATWTISFLCVLTGCVAGCCLIPFCMSRLNNVHHQCPECRAIVHTYRPL